MKIDEIRQKSMRMISSDGITFRTDNMHTAHSLPRS